MSPCLSCIPDITSSNKQPGQNAPWLNSPLTVLWPQCQGPTYVSNHHILPAPCRGLHMGKAARIYCSNMRHKSLHPWQDSDGKQQDTKCFESQAPIPSELHDFTCLFCTFSQSITADKKKQNLELMPVKSWNRERPGVKTAGRYIDTFVAC